MSINKLSTINSYWECEQLIGSERVSNVMARSRFEDMLQYFNLLDSTFFNQIFSNP